MQRFRRKSSGGSPKYSNNATGNLACQGAWDDCLPVPRLQNLYRTSIVVFSLAVVCYAISYDGEFTFDDSEAIVSNKDVTTDVSWDRIFQDDFWGRKLNSTASHKSYRPLTVITFRWNYIIAGGLYPSGFHVTNIILYGIVCVILLNVLNRVVADGQIINSGFCSKLALLSTLLFTVHPIHTENVAALVGRADLMCGICYLVSWLFYMKCCSVKGKETVYYVYMFTSMMTAAVSVLFKEQGITVLGVCGAYDLLMVAKIDIFNVFGMRKQGLSGDAPQVGCEVKTVIDSNKNMYRPNKAVLNKRVISRLMVLVFVAGMLLLFRWRIMGSTAPTFQVVDNPHSFVNRTLFRFLNYNYIYALNAWLLVNPWWLCFDWAMGCVPVINKLSDVRLIAVVLFWTIVGLLLSGFISSSGKTSRLLSLSMASIIIPFLPASNLFFRVGFVVAERNLFLPSIGYCLLVAIGFFNLYKRCMQYRKVLSFLVYVMLAVFIARTIHRSNEWRTESTLFEAGDSVCPLNAKVQYNIGKISADVGKTKHAIEKYRLAISLFPEYDQPMNNLANILKDIGELTEAERLLEKAVSIRPTFAAAWMNLGIVQSSLKKYTISEQSYFNAIKHRWKYPDCYFNLGNLYLETKNNVYALQAWRNSTTLKPTHVSAWSNMIILLDNLNRFAEAETVGMKALQFLPNTALIYYNIANVLGKQSKFMESEKYFNIAIRLDPKPIFYMNMGVLYHRWDKLGKAERMYLKALELDPRLQHAGEYLTMVRRRLSSRKPDNA